MKNAVNAIITLVLVSALSACGGGGGSSGTTGSASGSTGTTTGGGSASGSSGSGSTSGGSSSGSGSSTGNTLPTAANLQQAVSPSYSAGSEQLNIFNAINTFRTTQGLGVLNQNVELDATAQETLTYIVDNSDFTLTETAGNPGYTAATTQERAALAGYAGTYVAEEAGGIATSNSVISGFGTTGAQNLIGTIWHRAILMDQSLTGIGVEQAVGDSGSSFDFVIDLGHVTAQNNASSYVGVYPTSGQTSVPLFMAVEYPVPFSGMTDSYADFSTGTTYPISIATAAGSALSVTSFTVTATGSSSPVAVTLFTSASNSNLSAYPNVAFIVGQTPFQANTTYNVSFSGSNTFNGVTTPVSKTWSFTTGS